MNLTIQRENYLTSSIAGFFTGLVFSILFYFVLFHVQDAAFTFSNLAGFHGKSSLLWLIDLLPIIWSLIFFIAYRYYHFRKTRNELL
ncbi:MAG: hypothetical protein H6539_07330, partial [Bacteroidales bacterium]|nr:hypothetical protein [Bacteroidales bacterium]